MRFKIMSDIHDEFYSDRESVLPKLLKQSKADYILLAGDILVPGTMNRLIGLKLDTPIFYVMGNHEFYRGSWDTTISYNERLYANTNIQIFENRMMIVSNSNIRIIGATLWTDFWVPTIVGKEYHGNNCVKGMTDFAIITGVLLSKWEDRHKKSLKFITNCLSTKHDGPTIVMTHHAPSFKSNHVAYKNSPISGGFCSDLDYLIEEHQPDYWIHGHCHESFDYKIGKTRVICNPMGYPNDLNSEFNKNFVIEV